jgi:spermidine synthase
LLSAADAHHKTHSPGVEHAMFGQIALACALMVASGFAGLAYQIVWTQQSTAWLGHESAAVLAVVAAFFGGLALGALALGSPVEHSSRPERWYAGCEITIGVWSVALALLLKPASDALLTFIGPQPSPLWHWSVAFFGTFFLLLPATVAMGATLPAMERVLATARTKHLAISTLYAANTFGAVIGVLAAAFWLVPQLGLVRSAIACALLNFGCAATALSLQTVVRESADTRPASSSRRVLLLLAITGLLGIGYEVLIVRALSQIAENTVYTFAILLAVYLVGTAVGAAIYARWLVNASDSDRLRNYLLQSLAVACLLGTLSLATAERIRESMLATLGMSTTTALAAEAAIAATAFFLPALIMGALFSHLSTGARGVGVSFGRSIGVNTLGAAVAPFLFGVLLLPLLGLKLGLLLISIAYLALATRGAWSTPLQWSVTAAIVGGILWAPSLQTARIPEGGRLIAHIEGVMADVSVIEDAAGIATLHINNRQQEGSSATLLADARQALLPVLLHPAPKRALFLGVGTGLTSSSATLDPALHVDAVELVPEVISATPHFENAFAANADRSRLRLMSADARRFVRTSPERYDVIVSDNFHPARSGSASLYTAEHFASVRERLAQGGLFCQWLPLHQLDVDTLRSIVRSYMTVYPHGSALLATLSLDTPVIGLISRRDGEAFDLRQVRERIDSATAFSANDFGIADDLSLLGSFIAGPRFLTKFAGDAPLNTDDRPIVAYRAPNITYAPNSTPRDRLVELLREAEIGPAELLVADTGDWSTRLTAYWTARNQFIAAGRNVHPSSDVREMLAQVREPLLDVLHTSPDFRPAYDPLLRMAAALSRIDRDAARSLLGELRRAQPDRPEAGELLGELGTE